MLTGLDDRNPTDGHQARAGHPLTTRLRRSVLVLFTVAAALMAACQPTPPPPPSPTAKAFTFTGGGWGHAVGMSQYGALGMAEANRSYAQILSTYYPGTALTTRALNDNLRVLIAERRAKLTFVTGGNTTFSPGGTVPSGRTVSITRSGNDLQLSGAISASVPNSLTISWAGDLRVSEVGHGYRYGTMTVKVDPSGGLRAIVGGLTMNQYLYGLAEMPALWQGHALRAQAVAARTFAQKRSDSRGGRLDYDLLSTVSDQVYAGTTHEHQRWTDSVNATNAEVLTHNGTLIDAVYSSSNGGHSESSEYVWGGKVPYLQARPDPYDQTTRNPNRQWTRTYTAAQIGAWFGVGTATNITISGNRGPSGRVDRATVRVEGTNGAIQMTGNQFRARVNQHNGPLATQLLSTKFDVTVVK